MSYVETLVENEKKVTQKAIVADLNNDEYSCLYFATEEQIDKLIKSGKISEDISSIYQDYQEELRVIKAEYVDESFDK
jgi:hypothetical protein